MYGIRLFLIGGPHDKIGQTHFTEIYSSFFGAKLGFGEIRKQTGTGIPNWYIQEEGATHEEIDKKIDSKLEKLDLYLKLSKHYGLGRPHMKTEFFQTKEEIFGGKYFHFDEIFKGVDENSFISYLEKPIAQKEKVFIDSLRKVNSDIKSFAEIVEYYEYIKGERTKFHWLRDVLSHIETNTAVERVNEHFPNEFDFEENELLRDSRKNQLAIKQYLDEILLELKPLFINKINSDF